MDKAIKSVRERCESICRRNRSDCFVKRDEQTGCVADMIIDKASSLFLTLSAALRADDRGLPGDTGGYRSEECGLSSWIKHLQVVHLITLSRLVLDGGAAEKRREIRYPLPGEFQGQIEIVTEEGIGARLMNFSQRGMQVHSPRAIEKGEVFRFRLATNSEEGRGNLFRAESAYCVPMDGTFVCGARILDMEGSGAFSFLSQVHQLVLDFNRRAYAGP